MLRSASRDALLCAATLSACLAAAPCCRAQTAPRRSVRRIALGAAAILVPWPGYGTGVNDEQGNFYAPDAKWGAGFGAHAAYALVPAIGHRPGLGLGLSPSFEWGGAGRPHSERVLRVPLQLEIVFPRIGPVHLSLVPGLGYVWSWHSDQQDMAGHHVMLRAQGATMHAGLFATFPSDASVQLRVGGLARFDVEGVTNGGPGYENGPVRAQLVLVLGVDWKL